MIPWIVKTLLNHHQTVKNVSSPCSFPEFQNLNFFEKKKSLFRLKNINCPMCGEGGTLKNSLLRHNFQEPNTRISGTIARELYCKAQILKPSDPIQLSKTMSNLWALLFSSANEIHNSESRELELRIIVTKPFIKIQF